ncbi:DEAD/DEAH box helicase [Cuneatibacter sp. NSJ-177]|uniref:SNF2-related protein n=1 Tax=Cuneatibacter sp. NSJ-177 TaxID=2931401 RepID=UPI001FD25F7A|nr:DEAD/DEAH box helicase [Cuneatibacter sp. NSJ-177]MCJ7834582.1 DEAD/DEAH box helicase [Cuneatibacter sp. NSJ-177]
MKFVPHDYQTHAIEKILELPSCGLFLEMGLGKTVCTLTAIHELIYDRFTIFRVLVIAPKRVAEDTWTTEAEKWDHLQHLKISRVLGSAKERLEALREDADVYVINRENVVWLVENHKWNFDMVVVDELSSFKNNQAKRFKALRKMIPLADRFVGLTGTPAPNGMIDLWPQLYLIDRGERLGKTITCYRQRYFFPAKVNGPVVYTWELKPGSAEAITKKISDVCISMKAEDYLTMPELTVNDIKVKLAPAEEARYRELERQRILELEGETITAVTAAAACNKLLQMADGCVYDAAGVPVKIHERKLDALADILEFSQGQPVLVFYNYRFELDQLRERFGATRTIQGQQDIRDWNTGRIPLLLAQPASMGHGLNLQAGGHIIVWYGLTWSLELYQQANARLYRQGQQEAVVIHRLIAAGTMDEEVVRRLESKTMGQESLLEAVKARIRRYKDAAHKNPKRTHGYQSAGVHPPQWSSRLPQADEIDPAGR